jgi:peptide/nickel transport system substrate-binding protein
MVAALEKGEIDAAHDVPSESFAKLEKTDGIVAVNGEQGGFTEIALNGGMGLKKGNPALSSLEFRKAIAHAIDRQTLIDRVSAGLARPGVTMSPSANPKWIPDIPENEQFGFDLEQAKSILDAAGFKDGNGNGIREVDGKDINLSYYILNDSTTAAPNAEFITGWLKEIGIGTTVKAVSGSNLTEIIGKGDYDLFQWGWTPYVDPDPMLSYFQCSQLSKDPEDPTNYYNDANWCSPAYDALYKAQNVELNPDKRLDIAHRMLKLFYASASYNVIAYSADLQAYRSDRFEGWVRQPAETGPVMFSNTSPSYVLLTPVASSGGGGLSTAAIVAIIAVVVLLLVGVVIALRRRSSKDERE